MTGELRELIKANYMGGFFLRVLRPPFIRGHYVTDVFRFIRRPGALCELLESKGYECRLDNGLGFITIGDALLLRKSMECQGQLLTANISETIMADSDFETIELAELLLRYNCKLSTSVESGGERDTFVGAELVSALACHYNEIQSEDFYRSGQTRGLPLHDPRTPAAYSSGAERELMFMLLCPVFGKREIIPRVRRLAAVCLRERRGSAALTFAAVVLLHDRSKEL